MADREKSARVVIGLALVVALGLLLGTIGGLPVKGQTTQYAVDQVAGAQLIIQEERRKEQRATIDALDKRIAALEIANGTLKGVGLTACGLVVLLQILQLASSFKIVRQVKTGKDG